MHNKRKLTECVFSCYGMRPDFVKDSSDFNSTTNLFKFRQMYTQLRKYMEKEGK